ncbi:mannosyltransferase putative-domain-containing protein [Aspergillus lucknowensis]|uniref:Mannosyltransferase putative-domain-containing protein n=1 Tax=Aspergillus lucknowensis TaxID=176173 RepID=A0ABR4LUJ6_9EURO
MLARRRSIFIFLSFLIVFSLINAYYIWNKRSQPFDPRVLNWRSQLWQSLHPLLEQYAPDCPRPTLHGSAGPRRFDAAIKDFPRQNQVMNVDEIQAPMQHAHDGFVHGICSLPGRRAYVPDTMGIVSSAGGTYLPTFVVSVLLLRRTGSTLPVELFMRDWMEYEPYACEVILPPLGVKCLILSEIMARNGTKSIDVFQIKSYAMLFTSFEKFLWLDADCVPLHDPADILNSEPFTSTGLVTWPDFWANTAAPVYFKISRQVEPLSPTRQATEAGMLLVSKKTHIDTLILAAYYNYYGPDYYYPLLDQGAPGAGDKDTFLHAATALNQSFYAVSEPVVDLGNSVPWNPETATNSGWVQADPIQDFNLTSRGEWGFRDATVSNPPRAFFIHAGDPEFNPGKNLLGGKLHRPDGSPTRLWTSPPEAMRRLGSDVEKAFWEETMSVACMVPVPFDTWKGIDGHCEDVKAHYRAVFEDPDAEVPEFIDG